MRFSNVNLKKIKPYKTSIAKAWTLSKHDKVLKLDWNESTVPPSPKVFESINKVIAEKNFNWYPNINNKLLRIIAKYCDVKSENIEYFGSSDYLHEYIARAFICDNDKLVSISPTYDNFRAVAESYNAKITKFPLDPKFNLDLNKFQKFLKDNPQK